MRWLLAVMTTLYVAAALYVAVAPLLRQPVCRCAQEFYRLERGVDAAPCPRHGPL